MWLLFFWSSMSHNHPKQPFPRLNHVSLVPQCKRMFICSASSWQVLNEISVSCDTGSSAAGALSRTHVWTVQWHFPIENAHNTWELNSYSRTFSLEQRLWQISDLKPFEVCVRAWERKLVGKEGRQIVQLWMSCAPQVGCHIRCHSAVQVTPQFLLCEIAAQLHMGSVVWCLAIELWLGRN